MEPVKILIVEDETITAMALETSLRSMGYFVSGTVSTGGAAVLAGINMKPDLILMDIRLEGDIDGIMAAQQIKPYRDVPVIYLTAHTDPDTLKRVIHTMPYGFMSKPFTDSQLKEAIEQALLRHRHRRNLKQ